MLKVGGSGVKNKDEAVSQIYDKIFKRMSERHDIRQIDTGYRQSRLCKQ